MDTLKLLKRTTAIAAIAALPLAPMLAHAESAQLTGTQPATAKAEAGQQKNDGAMQAGAPTTNPEEAGAEAIKEAVQSAEGAQGARQTAGEAGPANETGIVVEGKEGTQSGEAPDMAPTDDQTGLAATGQQGQAGQQARGGLVPSDKEIDVYKSQEETAPESATVKKKDSGYVESTGAQSGQQAQTGQQAGTGQQTETGQQAGQPQTSEQAGAEQSTQPSQQGQAQAGQGVEAQAGTGQDVLVATVGEREIRQSDIVSVISMLPPELQQQPPQLLVPMALDQLVMRELILQEAQKSGLESDPAVEQLGDDAPQQAKEDAMVQAWLSEELGKAVTEQKVEESYANLKQQFGDQAPPMETIRPQIEQELRQQAFMDLSKELQEDADVTLYGPDGEPVEEGQAGQQ